MARIRTIKPKFFDDIKIGRLSRDARLLYIAMWVFADDLGVCCADTIWLKSRAFPYDQIQVQQFEKWMNELVKHGFIRLLTYQEERFAYLPNFTRHQVINRPNYEDLNIPKHVLDKELQSTTEQSLNNHGTITEQSVPIIGIGKEEDKENSNTPIVVLEQKKRTPPAKPDEPPSEEHERYVKYTAWLQESCPYIAKHFTNTITEREFCFLLSQYTANQICETITQIENRVDLRKKYTNLYRTALNWLKRDNPQYKQS